MQSVQGIWYVSRIQSDMLYVHTYINVLHNIDMSYYMRKRTLSTGEKRCENILQKEKMLVISELSFKQNTFYSFKEKLFSFKLHLICSLWRISIWTCVRFYPWLSGKIECTMQDPTFCFLLPQCFPKVIYFSTTKDCPWGSIGTNRSAHVTIDNCVI